MTAVGGARSALPCLAPDIGGTKVDAAMVLARSFVRPRNLLYWRDFPLRQSLRDALGVGVFADRGARALALAATKTARETAKLHDAEILPSQLGADASRLGALAGWRGAS